MYESQIRKVKEPSAYEIWQVKKELEKNERKELLFVNKLGYNNIAKCIEKEFNGDYQLFKKELNRKINNTNVGYEDLTFSKANKKRNKIYYAVDFYNGATSLDEVLSEVVNKN